LKCGAAMNERAKFCKACGAGSAMSGPAWNEKKARVMAEEKTWKKPAAIAAVVLAVVGGLWLAKGVYTSGSMEANAVAAPLRDSSARLAHAEAVKSEGGVVRIPVDGLENGKARFFSYTSGSRIVTFFVMKAADGGIRTAYDACMACNHAKLGYRQEGGALICNNCGMGFKPEDIGARTGGCSPIPVDKSIDGKMVVLKAQDLEQGARYF
jgi:hypothetical protein